MSCIRIKVSLHFDLLCVSVGFCGGCVGDGSGVGVADAEKIKMKMKLNQI